VETIRKIQQVVGGNSMGITQIKEWYNRFKHGRTLVESNACISRPSTSQNNALIDQVQTLVIQARRVTVQELLEEVGISTGLVHSILTVDSALRRVSLKFVPKLIQTFSAKHNIPVVQQAPYCPNMGSCSYCLFSHLKT
jgi:transposase